MAGFSYDHRIRVRIEIPPHAAGISHSDGRYSRGKITSRRMRVMPAYEMTATEQLKYGSTLNVWQAIRLLQAWHPLIEYGRRFVSETDPYRKGMVVVEAAEWLASKTDSATDDQLAKLLADTLKTTQGEALVRFALLQVEALRGGK